MPLELTHVRLLVSDFEASFKFYRDSLGLEVKLEAGENTYAEFRAGKLLLALYRRELMAEIVGAGERPAIPKPPDQVALTFEVADVDATYEALREKGIEFVNPPHDQSVWFLRVAHLRDPEGNLIELNAPMPAME